MGTVILKRLLSLVPLLFIVSIGLFAVSLQLNPDKAAQLRAGGADAASIEVVERVKQELHLDDPVYVRYFAWLGDIARFDLGDSLVRTQSVTLEDGTTALRGRPVAREIGAALPRTLSIALVGIVFGVVVGIAVGLIGGLKPGSILDRLSILFATAGIAIPSYWLIMLLVIFFAIDRNLLPATGYAPPSDGWWQWLSHILLPGIAVGLAVAAITARQLRSSLMDVMGTAYIRTAWAKGGGAARVVGRHALKNAAGAPLTTLGSLVAHMIGGTIVIESLVGIQGIGQLTVNAVRANDITMIQGIVLLFVVVTVVINLVIDVAYQYLNPKVRIS